MRIVLTGATAGIGLECARAFCAEGHAVIGIARNADNLATLEKELEGFTGLSCDLSDVGALEALAPRLAAAAPDGVVDVLINNAGYGAAGPVELVPLGAWKAQFDTNVFGTIGVTQATLPLLRSARAGRIVMVSSVAGSVYAPFFAPYYSSKHALECISATLRLELEADGIDVTVVRPGAVQTGFASNEDAMLERFAAASERYAAPIRRILDWHAQLVRDGIGPETVVETIREAVGAPRPRPVYTVPAFPSVLFVAIAKALPARIGHAFVRRITGLQG